MTLDLTKRCSNPACLWCAVMAELDERSDRNPTSPSWNSVAEELR